MPSPKGSVKNKEARQRSSNKYKRSEQGRIRINATMAKWRKTPEGRASKAASERKYRQTDAYKATVAPKMKNRRTKRLAWLHDIKSRLCCSGCGYNDHPAALQFHHHNDDKVGEVTKLLLTKNASLDVVLAEIAKCVVLCANCHLVLHYEEHEDRVRARETTRGVSLPSIRGIEAPSTITLCGSKVKH